MAKSFVDTDLMLPNRDPDDLIEGEGDAAARLARQKEQIVEQVADAAEEIERLQMRQKELENARRELRELNRKQHEYEEGKKALIEQLNRKALQLGKEEIRLTRLLELVSATRKDFDGMLKELRSIREDHWPESGFEEELDSALALLESMRGVYNKSVARVDAQRLDRMGNDRTGGGAESASGEIMLGGWGFWLKAGLAFSLPLGLILLVLVLLHGKLA